MPTKKEIEEVSKALDEADKKVKRPRKKKMVLVPLVDLLRRAVMGRKYSDPKLFSSKKTGSHKYEDPGKRKARHKRERQNRKAGRK